MASLSSSNRSQPAEAGRLSILTDAIRARRTSDPNDVQWEVARDQRVAELAKGYLRDLRSEIMEEVRYALMAGTSLPERIELRKELKLDEQPLISRAASVERGCRLAAAHHVAKILGVPGVDISIETHKSEASGQYAANPSGGLRDHDQIEAAAIQLRFVPSDDLLDAILTSAWRRECAGVWGGVEGLIMPRATPDQPPQPAPEAPREHLLDRMRTFRERTPRASN